MLLHRGVRLQQRASARLVDRRDTERRFKSAGGIDGDAVEADEMRGTDQDREIELAAAQQAVRVGRHRS
jgi:hypothetical protein